MPPADHTYEHSLENDGLILQDQGCLETPIQAESDECEGDKHQAESESDSNS